MSHYEANLPPGVSPDDLPGYRSGAAETGLRRDGKQEEDIDWESEREKWLP